jgi:hypothetical protein
MAPAQSSMEWLSAQCHSPLENVRSLNSKRGMDIGDEDN